MRVQHQARALGDEALGADFLELLAERRGAPVLPDDRAMQRPAGLAVPEERRLALVGDAGGDDVFGLELGRLQRLARDVALRAEEIVGIVLDPTGLRVVLLELALRGRDRGAGLVEHDFARAGGSLVEREHVAHALILASALKYSGEAQRPPGLDFAQLLELRVVREIKPQRRHRNVATLERAPVGALLERLDRHDGEPIVRTAHRVLARNYFAVVM